MFYTRDQYNNIKPRIGRIVIAVIGVLILLVFLLGSFRIVSAGHVGVVTRFGAVNRVVEPGIVIKIPFAEGVESMETRTQKEEVPSSSASKDLQDVNATVAINYHLDGSKAVVVYQNIGTEYRERIISPAIQETFKATTAKFTASDLIVKRSEVKKIAFEDLKKRLAVHHLIVDDLNIVNFDFSEDFNTAIEAKVKAQQTLEQTRIEAETAKTKAQGQADSQRALKDSGSLSPEYLEFLALQKWDGRLPLYTSGQPFISIPSK